MSHFNKWLLEGQYTPFGEAFDIGITTSNLLNRFKEGLHPLECGGTSERDNGNGSLMRILLIFYYLQSAYGDDF